MSKADWRRQKTNWTYRQMRHWGPPLCCQCPFSSFVGRVFSSGKLTSPLTSQSCSKPCWPELSLGPRGAGTYCCFHFSAGRRQLAEPALAVAMCEAHGPPEANPIAMLLLQMHDLWLPGSPPTMPKTMAQMHRSQAIGSLQAASSYEGFQRREAQFLRQEPRPL